MKRYFCYGRTGGERYTALTEEDAQGYWVRYDDAIALARRAVEIALNYHITHFRTIRARDADEILAQAEQEVGK
jgi:hypothetical protein